MMLGKSTPSSTNAPDTPTAAIDRAVQSTQRVADQALDKLSSTAQDLRAQVSPLLQRAGEQAAALTQQGVDINLPAETKQKTDATPDVSQIVLTYSADRRISVNKQDVTLPELEKKLKDIYDQRKDKKIFLMAAGGLRYKDIIDVIDAAKGAGVEQVGIVTEGMQKAAGAGGN